MERMDKNFKEYVSKDPINRSKTIQISLCCSWFFDGIKLFKKIIKNFSPINITILNLPPNIRNEIGKGTFLLSYYFLAKGSSVETFLIEKCLIGEFQEFLKVWKLK